MITLQYFEGCPNATTTLQNLQQAMREINISGTEIRMIKVPGPEEAEKLNFQGSPTILINGVDIYTLKVPENFSYSCRFYQFKGVRTGIIPKHYIMEKITELYSDEK
ncbi:MAG TPA: DUF2703 domain-containing protein [Draconibacterium sp.]|nr:DUF2703 domain-containing protein [Draconibacterium sp.]